MDIFDLFIGVLFAWSIWFAYTCGVNDCQKNSCFRATRSNKGEDEDT